MGEKKINKTVFSVASLDHLQDVSIHLMALFLGHWLRIFGYWHPHSTERDDVEPFEDEITEISEDSYFWRTIITEILELEGVTIEALVEVTQIEEGFWRSCLSKHYDIVMPLKAGEQLLLLHERLRPDLQTPEELS